MERGFSEKAQYGGVKSGHLKQRENKYVEKPRMLWEHGIKLQVVQEDIVEADLKLKGIPDMFEVIFIIYVNIFQLVFLN